MIVTSKLLTLNVTLEELVAPSEQYTVYVPNKGGVRGGVKLTQ